MNRTRQPTLLPAILITALAAGCSTALLSPREAETRRMISQAEKLAARGDPRSAISRYEQALAAPSPNPWRDKVLFNLGCLYAAADNPDPDFVKALDCFRALKKDHPKSRFNAHSRVWLGLLEKLVSLEAELETGRAELAANKLLLERELARQEEERLEREARSAELSLQNRKLKDLEALVATQQAALESLRRQLNKMKEIDIRSEKKAKGIK
jgi:hypothetical protein